MGGEVRDGKLDRVRASDENSIAAFGTGFAEECRPACEKRRELVVGYDPVAVDERGCAAATAGVIQDAFDERCHRFAPSCSER